MVFLCLATASAQQAPTSIEEARQTANSADDKATTLEGRQSALRQLLEASRIFENAGENVEAARVLNRIGRLQLILNDRNAALTSHRAALDLLKQKPDPKAEVDNLIGLGWAYFEAQQIAEAEAAFRQAISQSQSSDYKAGEAEATISLSELQNDYQNHVVALETAQKALALWQEVDDKAGLANAYSIIGQCYLAQNLLTEATQNYQTSLSLWRDVGNKSKEAVALISLGFIEYRKGNWQGAIAHHLQAQELVDEKAEPRRTGQVAIGLAEAFNESGLPETGLEHFQRGLEYYRKTNDPAFIAYALVGVGYTYYLLGNYAEAITYYNQAIAIVPADGLQAAQIHEYLGRVYIGTADYAEARQNLLTALAIYLRTSNPRETAQVQGLIGEIFQRQDQPAEARSYYEKALATFDRLSDRLNQAAILCALGRLELSASHYDLAEDYLRRSLDTTENIRRSSSSSDLTMAFSATVHERYQSYIECLMRQSQLSASQNLVARAFEASESERGRSLAELLRATQTDSTLGVEPQLAQQEQRLRQELRVKEDQKISLLARTYQQEDLNAVNTQLSKLEAEYQQVSQNIRARYPNYEHLTQPKAWNLQRIQAEVVTDNDTVVLEYSLGNEKSYAWTVTRDHIASYELPPQAKINDAAQRVYRLLASSAAAAKNGDELTKATHELSELVLLPVGAAIKKPRVIVVADGALNYIPFQILSATPTSDEPLVTTTEVINAPSASILGQLREESTRHQTPTKVLAAFGDPVFESNYAQRKDASAVQFAQGIATVPTSVSERWPHALRDIETEGDSFDRSTIQPLFFATRELANLRTIAGRDALIVTGFDATRENLADIDLTKYAILHFATHGVLDPKHPENSGLFLSMVARNGKPQDGFVGLQDIYSLHAPVDLVVLSACRTGLGKDVRGEGLIGLTRGFMYAGASSVMASLWKVDDEATSELMKRFYVNLLQKGMTPAAALRAAQNSIRNEPQWRSPYFWAAFTLQGEYRQVITPSGAGSISRTRLLTVSLLVLVLLAAGAGLVWLRRRKAQLV